MAKEAKKRTIHDIVMSDKGLKNRNPLKDYTFNILEENIEFLSLNSVVLNLLYSGRVNGGIPIGHMSMISAPSMLGKSFIAMQVIKNAQRKGMQVVVIDTERAFKESMANTLGIDLSPDKVTIFRESSIEAVESIITTLIEELTPEEKRNTIFVVDSWGTLVTSKAVKDATTGNDVTDMTEAKKKNRLANIMLGSKSTFFIVNHVYDNTGGFGDPLRIPGGRRIFFNSEAVCLGMSMAKDKDKTTKEIKGNIITAKTAKSSFAKGESKLKYRINYNGGLDPFFGLLEDAMEAGYVEKPKGGYYTRPIVKDDKPCKEKDIYCVDFWKPVFDDTDFSEYLEAKYTYDEESIVREEEEFLDTIFN